MKLDMTYEQYEKLYKGASKNSACLKNAVKAFVVGGGICLLGQALLELWQYAGLTEKAAGTAVSVSLIGLSVLLTALGLYSRLAKHAGAGTLVPITGFANAVAAPAIEYRPEGLVTGLGAKLFTVAGPVILYGALVSVIIGAVRYFAG